MRPRQVGAMERVKGLVWALRGLHDHETEGSSYEWWTNGTSRLCAIARCIRATPADFPTSGMRPRSPRSRCRHPASTVVTLVPDTCNTVGGFGQRLLFILAQGSVRSVPLPAQAGSPVAPFGTCAPGSNSLMPCGSDACWLDEGVNAMMRMDPAGGPMATIPLQGSLTSPVDVAFDGSKMWVSDNANNAIQRY